MASDGTGSPSRGRSVGLAREERERRVLDTAAELFYARGVHEVGMDELVRATGFGKATIYRLFPTKDALIGAYLERAAASILGLIDRDIDRHADDPRAAVAAIFEAVAADLARPEFRGCAFNNASIEFPDPTHPARAAARAYRAALCERLTHLAERARPGEGERVGAQLALILDGMYVNAAHLGPGGPAAAGPALARVVVGPSVSDEYPEVTIESLAQWRDWLTAHHADSRGVWVTTYKKHSGRPSVPVGHIVDEALAHGWIDSRPRSVDGARSQRLLTPRRPTSSWSSVNKQRVERLINAGRMTPAGLAAIETAKRNGSWTALDEVETLTEPDDLRGALDASPPARRYWDAFPRSTKRAILEWIAAAKTAGTREKRVTETVAKAAVNLRANQWRQPKGAQPPD